MRVLDTLGIAVAAATLTTSARGHAPGRRTAAALRRPTAIGVPRPAAGRAGRLRQRRARALARLRRHPSALGPAPERQRRAGRARRRRARAAPTARQLVRAVAVGLEVCVRLGMAGYDPRRRQLDLLRARPARHLDLRRDGRRGGGGACCAARRTTGSPTPGRRRVAWRPASSRPTAPAAPSSGCTAAGPRTPASAAARAGRARAHRPADGPGGTLRLLPGLAARRVATPTRSSAGSASRWSVPGIFFKPYPANHFTHAAHRRGRRPARAGARPRRRSSDSCSASPRPTCAPSGSRSRSSVRPRPATWPSSAGRTPSGRACSAAAAWACRSPTSPTNWPTTRSVAALMQKVDVVADDRCTEIFPHQFPAVLTAQPHATARLWSRRCSPTGAGRSGRCRSRSSRRNSPTTSPRAAGEAPSRWTRPATS